MTSRSARLRRQLKIKFMKILRISDYHLVTHKHFIANFIMDSSANVLNITKKTHMIIITYGEKIVKSISPILKAIFTNL